MEAAPFHHDLAEGPDARTFWLRGDDGVRIRVGHWDGRAEGTIFIFPGRCEYVEKYGRIAGDLTGLGHGVLAIDWRGQGHADRLLKNPDIGHVRRFQDYQIDVRAYVAFAAELDLPRPWLMLAHSMGGAIGLRALCEGQPFAAAAFSAPMWGIRIAPGLRQLARTLPTVAKAFGLGGSRAPTSSSPDYFAITPFEENLLTTDRDGWDYMCRQATAEARFRLGGPSLIWLAEALKETAALSKIELPGLPASVSVGAEEGIVDPAAIDAMAARWESCTRHPLAAAKHELMMERPETRAAFLETAMQTFKRAGGPGG